MMSTLKVNKHRKLSMFGRHQGWKELDYSGLAPTGHAQLSPRYLQCSLIIGDLAANTILLYNILFTRRATLQRICKVSV